jgi:hypothetical protein
MPRQTGSRNHFRYKGEVDTRDLVVDRYGPTWNLVTEMRKNHLKKKGGCHICAQAIEDRLLGKPPVEVKHTGKNLQPIILVSVNDRPIIGQALQLEEGADEAEFEEVEDEGETPDP